MLIVMGGPPGTGRTTPARLLAARTGAVRLRVDSNAAEAFPEHSLEQNQWPRPAGGGRRYRLISGSTGKVWLCQIRREGSSG